ncbi:MAG: sialidase family protein [Planctomycetaceae bacterium]
MKLLLPLFALALFPISAIADELAAEFVFSYHDQHNHAPGIVECPNGDLLVSWYRGSGERKADDVAVYGSRRRKGSTVWNDAFLMVDTPGFPDGNTTMMIDADNRLWLFWPVIIANTWESCLTQYLVADEYRADGSPQWTARGTIFLKPDDFTAPAVAALDKIIAERKELTIDETSAVEKLRERLSDKLYQRLGWQPRCKPTVLPSGRILLPLYSDTYSISMMAISDDKGETWFTSQPLIGFGNIQPAVLRRDDGTLVAYMRENGWRDRIRISESTDDGMTWGAVGVTDFPNPGSGLDGLRLASGEWLLIYNDTTKGRSSLALSLSDDEGKTWKWMRHLERHETGQYHYPAIIQGADGKVHAVYSYFVDEGKTMKHAEFSVEWIKAGDKPQ